MKVLPVITAALVACASLVAGKAEDKAKKGDTPLEILRSDTCADLRETIQGFVNKVLAFEDEDIIETACSKFGLFQLEQRLGAYPFYRSEWYKGGIFFGSGPQQSGQGENSYNNICQAALLELLQDGVAELRDAAENEFNCRTVLEAVLEGLRSTVGAIPVHFGAAYFGIINIVGNFGLLVGSDERLKTDIRPIGKSPSGIPTYTFKYREDAEALVPGIDATSTYFGVMAQDLLALNPAAVVKDPVDGYYRVDYSKIDVDFVKM